MNPAELHLSEVMTPLHKETRAPLTLLVPCFWKGRLLSQHDVGVLKEGACEAAEVAETGWWRGRSEAEEVRRYQEH
jgi:hypothetical protein